MSRLRLHSNDNGTYQSQYISPREAVPQNLLVWATAIGRLLLLTALKFTLGE
jgi:hypothetical protein